MMRVQLMFVIVFACSMVTQGQYDYFKLASQWIPTFCSFNVCNQSHAHKQEFTIHGLWPTSYKYRVGGCNGKIVLKEWMIQPSTVGVLKDKWPQLKNNSHNFGFWSTEWNKHGICSETVLSPDAFFNVAMGIFNRVDPLGALRGGGILPDPVKEHDIADVKTAIRKKIQFNPDLTCRGKELWELRVCLTKQQAFRACPGLGGNCPAKIILPPA